MVTAELTRRPGESRCVHWPDYASVDMVHQRICAAFQEDWRRVRAVVGLGGRDFFEFEKPWLWMALHRHSTVQVDVRFERRSDDEAAAYELASGGDGDESDGYTTSSSVAEQIQSISYTNLQANVPLACNCR